ncbi:MAG: 3-oxoacyl-[acyl-carrier-protein] synthase 2 [Phycisphaerae bacterium]|nr:3-oxoacyl-[acyl-carrier-protein] synthase 2 [Phycisphaerae bacterium]
MTDSRRVVITGLGPVSPFAVGAAAYRDGLYGGAVGIHRIANFDPAGFPSQIGGEIAPDQFAVRDYVPKSYRKATKVMARDIELAVGAADLAVRDSGLTTLGVEGTGERVPADRMSTNIGAGLICADLNELAEAVCSVVDENGQFSINRWGSEGMQRLTPLWLLKYLPNMLSCHVSIIHGSKGPSNAITCAEASSLLSIGEAVRIIARDNADVALAGGAENKMHPMGLMRECLLGHLTTTHNDDPAAGCRPFDRDSDGTVIAEAGGCVVLEELSHATARSARIYAEVAGCGFTFSPYRMADPEPHGAGVADAIAAALADARMTPDDLDLIVPQALGVPVQDLAEARGLATGLGARASQIPTWPITPHLGNSGAALGAMNMIAAAMAIHAGRIPGAVKCPNPDPQYGLRISGEPIESKFRAALLTGYTIAGQNAAVILKSVGQVD